MALGSMGEGGVNTLQNFLYCSLSHANSRGIRWKRGAIRCPVPHLLFRSTIGYKNSFKLGPNLQELHLSYKAAVVKSSLCSQDPLMCAAATTHKLHTQAFLYFFLPPPEVQPLCSGIKPVYFVSKHTATQPLL